MTISSSSSHASRAFGGRSPGILLEQPADPRRQPRVDRRASASSAGGGSLTCRSRTAAGVSRAPNGGRPASSSNAITPSAYRSVAGPICSAQRLLGRHVGRRPDRGPGRRQLGRRQRLARRLRDPEVRDLDRAVERDHHVLGLEVAVHDPVLVRMGEPGQHAPRAHRRCCARSRPRTSGRSDAALEVLHRDVRRAVALEEVVHGDDVRVVSPATSRDSRRKRRVAASSEPCGAPTSSLSATSRPRSVCRAR